MTLTLTIENETNLPDGGPLSVIIQGKRGIDIGRDTHLDWTLPDPTRMISGKHCEVRHGDRFVVGNYIVVATLEGEDGAAGGTADAAAPRAVDYQALWADEGATP